MHNRDVETKVQAIYEVINETRVLFHRAGAAVTQLHGENDPKPGGRGVLESLAQGGPQTVPQLARARPVSRQHMQIHVNALLSEGLVALDPNPAHKRSPLVSITHAGEKKLLDMARRERAGIRRLDLEVSNQELQFAADVLRRVRTALESPSWERATARARTEA